ANQRGERAKREQALMQHGCAVARRFRLECTASKPTPSQRLFTMLILRGAPALSAFRHGKLLSQLTAKVPAVTGLYAEFAHFAEVSGTLGADEEQVLARLLKY